MKRNIIYLIIAALALLTWACENENDEKGGTPVVKYIRPCDAEVSDSLLVGAYLGNKIAIIGESLAGVNKIYFNDVVATLNPNMVTDDAIIVTVPSSIPETKKDIIILCTSEDSCVYDFETLVPDPTVSSMTYEYVNIGDVAHIEGLYFVDDSESPLNVTFTGGVQGEIVSSDLTSIDVTVPEGAEVGPVTVSSVYGVTESLFWLYDNRNIIADFGPENYPDYYYYFGWHGASGVSDVDGINGYYLIINGDAKELTDDSWDDGFLSWEKWTYLPTDPDFFDAEEINSYACKFEVKVLSDWSCKALQVIFTGSDEVMLNWQNGNGLTYGSYAEANSYVTDTEYPRALWQPWTTTDEGVYTTDGEWITVTIPMSNFKYGPSGESLSPMGSGHYSGITIFLNDGGYTGTACNVTMYIDNLRIVPN